MHDGSSFRTHSITPDQSTGRGPLFDPMLQDLRYALRTWRRTPIASGVAVLTLALGIGATTAIFSLIDALVLRAVLVDRPEELRTLHQITRVGGVDAKTNDTMSYAMFRDLYAHREMLSEAAAFTQVADLVVEDDRRSLRIDHAVFATDNYFSVLGVAPVLGRGFLTGQRQSADPATATNTAVLSNSFWRRAFGGDAAVIGNTIRVGTATFTIVGVMPARFVGAVPGRTPDLFLSFNDIGATQPGIVAFQNRDNVRVQTVGRIRPDISEQVAEQRLTALVRQLAPAPQNQPQVIIAVLPIDTGFSDVRARLGQPLLALMLMVSLLMFVTCANVGLMRLSQTAIREAETAIRISIGAGRRRLLQQMMTEGALLAAVAGGIGLLLAPWAISALLAMLPAGAVSLDLDIRSDPRVLLFTFAISLLAALIFGLGPAVRALRIDATSTLVSRKRGAINASRLGGIFVSAQVAMAVVMLTTTGLLVETLRALANVDPGFKPNGIALITIEPGRAGYTAARLEAYYREVLSRVESTPGVLRVSASQLSFLGPGKTTGGVHMPGFMEPTDAGHWIQVFQVGARFFSTMGIHVVNGRDFAPEDLNGGRVIAAINESAARRYFPGENPIGRILTTDRDFEIVAVVQNSHYNTLREPGAEAMFVPFLPRPRGSMVVTARLSNAEGPGLASVLREIQSIDAQVPSRAVPLQAIVSDSLARERILAVVSSFFGFVALFLIAVGLFGVTTLRTQQRTAEIGIRMALGARLESLLLLTLREPLTLAATGLVVGLPFALAATRTMSSLLLEGATSIALTTIIAAGSIFLIVAGATFWPAWKAARLNPVVALRQE